MKSKGLLTMLLFVAIATPDFAQMGSSGVEGTGHLAGHITLVGFLEQLMRNTAAQIEWSRITQARTTDPEIKAFAKKIEFQSTLFAYEINQRGQTVHAQFDPVVSGKLKETSDKLRTIPVDQLDVAYLKNLEDVGHETVDLFSDRYNTAVDADTQAMAMHVGKAVAIENSDAHDLLKKLRKEHGK